MTAREILEFLEGLTDEELDMDAEIMEGLGDNNGAYTTWIEGVGVDDSGLYFLDKEARQHFHNSMIAGDKLSGEV